MLGLYREHYADFTVKHFHEQLLKRHDYMWGSVTSFHFSGFSRILLPGYRSLSG